MVVGPPNFSQRGEFLSPDNERGDKAVHSCGRVVYSLGEKNLNEL